MAQPDVFSNPVRFTDGVVFSGSVKIQDGTLSGTEIAVAGLPATRLTTTLQTGFIPLALDEARELAAGATQNAAANGGILASDTTPVFERVNGATDIQLRLRWAAANVDEVTWQFAYPPDLDDTANVTIKILASMAGATSTPTVQIKFFEGVGDADAGGNTAAVTGTSVAVYSVVIAASNIGPYPTVASIALVPAAHAVDALHLYAIWAEYQRK